LGQSGGSYQREEILIMQITTESTVRSILDAYPGVVEVFLQHGVDVPSQCDDSILDVELSLCDSMCHVDDLDGLIRDLQKFIDKNDS
jgi:hypothetical protein